VAAVCIEAAAVLVLSADREAAARFGDRWAVARHADRPAEPLCVGRWAVVPLWVRAEVLPYADGWAVAPLWVRPGADGWWRCRGAGRQCCRAWACGQRRGR
jgi:hypothetical protein